MPDGNRQWLLRERPTGMIGPEHYELVNSPMPEPDLDAGEVLVKTLMLGFDPAMRGWVNDEPSYLPPVGLGEPMRASGVGQVVSSRNPDLPEGALVQGLLNWQEYSLAGSNDSAIPLQVLPEGTPPGMAPGSSVSPAVMKNAPGCAMPARWTQSSTTRPRTSNNDWLSCARRVSTYFSTM